MLGMKKGTDGKMSVPFLLNVHFLGAILKSNVKGAPMKKYTPYDFNTKYEYRTHKYVGRDYGKLKTSNKRIIGKKSPRKNQDRYMVCNTYTEWKRHVKSIIRKDFSNYEDFLHWLYLMKRDSEKGLQIVINVQIPIYIVFVSAIMGISNSLDAIIWIVSTVLFVVGYAVIAVLILISALSRIHFYNDIIEIAKAEAPPKS